MFYNSNSSNQNSSEYSKAKPQDSRYQDEASSNNQYYSTKFCPTKSQNPCPICNNTTGKCRIVNEDFILCMSYPMDRGLPEWKFLGETEGSYFAGKYLRVREETEAERVQRRAEFLQQKIEQQKLQEERFANLPNAVQRDLKFTAYLQKLSLDEVDKADLRRRNLSDLEIMVLGAKSTSSGYILPIRDPNKRILGFQIRLRDISSGRYRWHKPLGISAQQDNGELPLAFYPADILDYYGDINNHRLVLVEGTGVKPYLAAKKRNCPAIGASGGQFIASQKTLLQYFKDIGASAEGTRIEYAIDAGDIANIGVLRRHEKNLDFIANLGFAIDVMWWEQFTKDDDDIDELADSSVIKLLTVEQFWEIANYQPKNKTAPIDPINEVLQENQQKNPLPKAQGFVKRSAQNDITGDSITENSITENSITDDSINETSAPDETYASGKRLETWKKVLILEKHVLDTSETGTGKSHDVGLLRPEMFDGIERIIYIYTDSRNVTTETLQEWKLLPSRHQGLIIQGNKLRRANTNDNLHTQPNCSRTGAVTALIDKAITETNIICETCPSLNACRNSTGNGFGFKHERKLAFSWTILRSHPASLPSPDEYDYSKTLLVWEEVSESLSTLQEITVSSDDIDRTIAKISRSDISNKQQLIDVLNKIYSLLFVQSRYGLTFHEIKAAIPDSVNSQELAELFKQDLSVLDTVNSIADEEFQKVTGKEKKELARTNALLKKETAMSPAELERFIEKEILKQWFCEFLDILSGTIENGNLHIHKGKLKVSLLNPRLREIATHAAANLYLDATINPRDLEMRINAKAYTVQQVTESAYPNIYQVTNIGRMTMQRGKEQTRQTTEIVQYFRQVDPSTKVIDFKKFNDLADGAWFRDSRGSNDFIEAKTFVIVGTPCPNIAALMSEYVVLTGLHPPEKDEGFSKFVDRKILTNIQQCFGRKSGHRFHKGDKIYFLSNFNLGNIPHTKISSEEITANAMTKNENIRREILQKIYKLVSAGFDALFISEREIARLLEISRRRFRDNSDWINSLLMILYNKMIQNFSEIPPANLKNELSNEELINVEFWSNNLEHLLVTQMPVDDLLNGISEFFNQDLPKYLDHFIIDRLSFEAKSNFFSALFLLSPPYT